jgi:hypothetical protein
LSGGDSENDRFDFEALARIGRPEGDDEALFYRRTTKSAPRPRLISKRDIAEVAIQAIMAAAAATRPPETWPGLCRRTSRLRHARLVRSLGPFRDALRAVLGDVSDSAVEQYFDQFWDGLHRRRMMLIREYVGGGPVKFTLTGREHLDAASALGRGAILWAGQFLSQTLAGKRGLFEAGIHAYQVSSGHHGFRGTWVGNKTLNQLLVRAENRYLAGRLTFEGEEAGMLIRKVMRLLKTGAFVIFTNNLYAGRSFVQMPLGAAGFIGMPTTPIALALRGQIPLLFMSTIEREPLAHYEIRISADLAAEEHSVGQAESTSHNFPVMARVALKTRDEFLAALRTAPDQYLSWPPFARPIVRTADESLLLRDA